MAVVSAELLSVIVTSDVIGRVPPSATVRCAEEWWSECAELRAVAELVCSRHPCLSGDDIVQNVCQGRDVMPPMSAQPFFLVCHDSVCVNTSGCNTRT